MLLPLVQSRPARLLRTQPILIAPSAAAEAQRWTGRPLDQREQGPELFLGRHQGLEARPQRQPRAADGDLRLAPRRVHRLATSPELSRLRA